MPTKNLSAFLDKLEKNNPTALYIVDEEAADENKEEETGDKFVWVIGEKDLDELALGGEGSSTFRAIKRGLNRCTSLVICVNEDARETLEKPYMGQLFRVISMLFDGRLGEGVTSLSVNGQVFDEDQLDRLVRIFKNLQDLEIQDRLIRSFRRLIINFGETSKANQKRLSIGAVESDDGEEISALHALLAQYGIRLQDNVEGDVYQPKALLTVDDEVANLMERMAQFQSISPRSSC